MANSKIRSLAAVFLALASFAPQFAAAGVIEINNSGMGSSASTITFAAANPATGVDANSFHANSRAGSLMSGGAMSNSGTLAVAGADVPAYADAGEGAEHASARKSEHYAMMLVGVGLLGFSARRKSQF